MAPNPRVMPELCLLSSLRVVLIAIALLFSAAARCAASPQTIDPAAGAKAHYQKAIAAIAKDDWSTAKNELIQAKRLAPRNALVSYDLALAYKHMGQLRSARSELVYPNNPLVSTNTSWPRLDRQESTTSSSGVIDFPLEKRNSADRMRKALHDAIEKCGGKRVKDLY